MLASSSQGPQLAFCRVADDQKLGVVPFPAPGFDLGKHGFRVLKSIAGENVRDLGSNWFPWYDHLEVFVAMYVNTA